MKKRIKISVMILVLSLFPAVFAGSACGEPGKFTVTFIGNGGTLYSGVTVQTVSSADEIEPPTFRREGYTFVGWDSDLKDITSDLTLNAEWTPNSYELTFDANGGSVEIDKKSVVFDGAVGNLPVPTHENESFIFSHWIYEERGAAISGGTVWTYPENATLKAVWIEGYAINFVLTCEVDGYTVQCLYNNKDKIDSVTVAKGQALGAKLVTPVAVNGEYRDYSFIGWYYGEKKITKDTVFSEAIFNNTSVTLTVKCKLDGIWTKPY